MEELDVLSPAFSGGRDLCDEIFSYLLLIWLKSTRFGVFTAFYAAWEFELRLGSGAPVLSPSFLRVKLRKANIINGWVYMRLDELRHRPKE